MVHKEFNNGNTNTIQGGAYEFACMDALKNELGCIRKVKAQADERYEVVKNDWDRLTSEQQDTYQMSARTAVEVLLNMEPNLLEGDDELELSFQKDSKGEDGDVRDILIRRPDVPWEIGLSVKHNHFAVKHSRLGKTLDFCKSWFGHPCSETYWNSVTPIFNRLQELKDNKVKFSEIDEKEATIYRPVLDAFKGELLRINAEIRNIPALLVEYLLGKYDFYKVVSVDNKCLTMVQAYNLHGSLNKEGGALKPLQIIPVADLPKRIIYLDYKPNSDTTLELYLDNGWQFTFRIHNAATYCEPSLKFDIQIVGMPSNIICIRQRWEIK